MKEQSMSGLLWLLIWGGLFYFMMRFGCGSHMVHGAHGGHGGHNPDSGEGKSHQDHRSSDIGATDPVCGMKVDADDGYSRTYQGRQYRFCSRNCLDQFDREPTRYAKEEKSK